MIIEIEHDWYDSSGNSYEGVPTTFEISSELVIDDSGEYTEYSATLLYIEVWGAEFNKTSCVSVHGHTAVQQAEDAAEEYCAEGFTE